MANTTFDLHKLLKVPPVEFEKLLETLTKGELDELEGCVLHLLRMWAYLDARLDGDHKQAVRKSNKVMRIARKAMGYNITRDLNF